MTHALQVLHTLQWHHPGGRALVQLAQAPTQDYHSYTHTLLGVVDEHVVGPSDPTVKKTREHSAAKQLWPNRGRHNAFPLLGLGGKRCSLRARRRCRWSRTPCSATGRGGVTCLCDLRPCLAGHEKNGMLLHQSSYLPTCKTKANEGVFAAEEPSHTPGIIPFSV